MKFKIANREIGSSEDPLIIAEIGINHNGNLDQAIVIADSAIQAGAEVLKHQTHIPDEEMSLAAHQAIPGNSKHSIYKIVFPGLNDGFLQINEIYHIKEKNFY